MTKKTTDTMIDAFEERLARLIRIPSVYEEEEGSPFGEYVRLVLHEFLDIAREDGFSVKNVDDYAGHAEFGEGEEILGILAHLDVVPAGKGWTYPPFQLTKENGKYYGRGTQDDKGPLMAAYIALKELKEEGFVPKKRIRLIAGTDEERDWKGIDHYFQKEEMPAFGFTPDAVFPVIHAEKGLVDAYLEAALPMLEEGETYIESITAGERLNMVPDIAEAVLVWPEDEPLDIPGTSSIKREGERVVVTFHGKAAHGSTPEEGENAALNAIRSLLELELAEQQRAFLSWIIDHLENSSGKGMNLDTEDEVSGALTMNIGTLEWSRHKCRIGLNLRYPVTKQFTSLRENLQASLPEGMTYEETDHMEPLYVPEDHPGVRTLLAAFEEETGEKSEAEAIGGATYARVMKNGVAFGAIFSDSADTAHQADECVSAEDMRKAISIYKKAIYEWTKA